nr:unnamed protein product [Callosobruchus chinensis]
MAESNTYTQKTSTQLKGNSIKDALPVSHRSEDPDDRFQLQSRVMASFTRLGVRKLDTIEHTVLSFQGCRTEKFCVYVPASGPCHLTFIIPTMLKWTVMPRPKAAEDQRPLPATPRSADRRPQRRRSTPSTRTRRSLDALEADKENQFTSTPIKGEALGGGLRDVSNLTPTAVRTQPADGKRLSSTKKSKASKKLIHTPPTSPRHRHKKKKDCITAHYYDFLSADSLASNYFRPLETVDSHIEGILDDFGCSCKPKKVADTYAPTLPTFTSEYSPCATRTTHCLETLNRNSSKKVPVISKILDDVPPNTKPRTDHVEDFLHQISFITSPETSFKQNRNKITPLVKRILDFKFSKCAEEQNDSSYINNMSLDKIVDAILDSSDDSIRPTVRRALNTSLIVNVESENEHLSKEENLMHAMEVKKVAMDGSENSSDSGFRSSATENPHSLDNNFQCKCNNNHKDSVTEKTIIQLDVTYNERCVDESSRKRHAITTTEATSPKRLHLDQSRNDLEFTLKRQRCIRRRRPLSIDKQNVERNCYLETKCLPKAVKEFSADFDLRRTKSDTANIRSDDLRISGSQSYNCSENSFTGSASTVELRPEKACSIENKEVSFDKCTEEDPSVTKTSPLSDGESEDKDFKWNTVLCIGKYVDDHSTTQPRNQELTTDEANCYLEVKSISAASTVKEESYSSFKSKTQWSADDSSVEKKHYIETRGLPSSTLAEESFSDYKNVRKCLLFDLSNNDSSLSEISSRSGVVDVRGCVELKIYEGCNVICVDVVRCTDLFRPNGEKINAYVKVCVSDRLGARKKNPGLQRTAVHSESSNPYFNHTFKFPLIQDDCQRRVHIEVWHRNRTNRISEFLGCVSFDVGNVVKEGPISGAYLLQAHRQGRSVTPPLAASASSAPAGGGMLQCGGDEGGACDDAVFLDDAGAAAYGCASAEELLSRSATCDDKQALDEQQKYADEHLFLRYLELDPTEGPDATCAATQRTAAAAAGGGATPRQGRTPFTHTKRLVRSRPSGGFGFSVVWTRPPRVERVERGGAADRAGLLPGDYVIFVDRYNVVTMPEMEVLSLIRSCGNQLTLEVFRRPGGGGGITSRNGSLPTANKRLSASCAPLSRPSTAAPPTRRPSTVCSTTAHTTVTEYGGAGSQRRRLHLATTPQAVAFCTEKSNNPEENRRKAMYQLISKEQQYATHLQFAISRFVSALNERKDLITPAEHRVLFQNCDEILRITEDILDNLIQEDGDPQIHLLVRTYHMKLHDITTAYRKYCSGIKKADCILANKTKNTNSEFSRFLQVPQIPRRRPDITAFIHKPLEHYREMLREITAGSGLMEPVGEGRPLLTVQDLENRLVFTKCKPFVLNKPGRQWIFGGDLTRVEGRNVRQCWALLFSDLLLFAKASRDRVLFVIEEPLPLSHVSDVIFNVRKKDTEFRLTINPEGKKASSPTVHCGPDLTRTPKKGTGRKTVLALRAPTPELKAVWQTLLQKQISYQATCNTDGSSPNSPLESPEVPITSSVATLHSAESLSVVRRQVRQADINIDIPTPTPYARHHTYPDKVYEAHSTRISSHSSSEILSSNHLSAVSRARISSTSSSQASQAFTSDFIRTKHQILIDKTPDTPSANISQSSSEISQAFTSHFNSEVSLIPKQSFLSDIVTPSAILTPSTEFCSNSDDHCDDIKFLKAEEPWDITQFNYDLSCLNIDGLSQKSEG